MCYGKQKLLSVICPHLQIRLILDSSAYGLYHGPWTLFGNEPEKVTEQNLKPFLFFASAQDKTPELPNQKLVKERTTQEVKGRQTISIILFHIPSYTCLRY